MESELIKTAFCIKGIFMQLYRIMMFNFLFGLIYRLFVRFNSNDYDRIFIHIEKYVLNKSTFYGRII